MDIEVSEGTNLAFDVSPDGRTLVFDLLGQLWKLPLEGGRATPLTDAIRDTAEDVDPVYSPDGRWIVFQADRPGGKGLWLIPADGGQATRITGDELVVDQYTHLQPTWSPDSREVVYGLGDRIHRLDVATRSTVSVTMGRPEDSGFLRQIGTPEISPDGIRLAFGTGAIRAFRLSVGAGARLWEAPLDGGPPRPLTGDQRQSVTPAFSPDGTALAFFATDSTERWQLWVQSDGEGAPRRLTDQDDIAIRRVRWTPDGRELIYSGDGKLWRIGRGGTAPKEIPFTAHVSFERPDYSPSAQQFPEPARNQPGRGFYGLSISPDGSHVAMLALDQIWVWEIGGTPRAVTTVPDGAYHLSWSGDGTEVVFTTGDLFAVDIESGSTRRLTELPGQEQFPAWSPDGRYIAFIYDGNEVARNERGQVRLMSVDDGVVRDLSATTALGRPPTAAWGSDEPVWSPDSRRLLLYGADLEGTSSVLMASVDGEMRPAEPLPRASSFVSWPEDDSIVYVHGVQLWKTAYDPVEGVTGTPRIVSEAPALYASASANGTILYVSDDGLRVHQPSGESQPMGWPVGFTTPPAPAAVLIRNVRVIDGTGGEPTSPQDLLIESGRIRRIEAAGALAVDDSVTVIDAEGRYVVPGLIDLHAHLWTPRPAVEGWLYHGVTTVRDVGSSLAWSVGIRDLIDSGLRQGPRVALGGSFFLTGNGLSKDAGLFLSGSDQTARGVSLVRGMGATLAKHYLDSWAGLTTLIAEAHRQGLRVTAHCGSLLPLVAAGIDGQEHAGNCARDGRLYEDYTRIKEAAGVWVVVGASQWRTNMEIVDEPTIFSRPDIHPFLTEACRMLADPEPKGPAAAARFRLGTERQRMRIARLHEVGVTVAVGTDYCLPIDVHIQMAGLVAAGFTPLEAITATTSVAAGILGAETEVGSILPGKLADLVILEANPLEDIRNVQRIWQVLQGGLVVDRAALLDRGRTASAIVGKGPNYGY